MKSPLFCICLLLALAVLAESVQAKRILPIKTNRKTSNSLVKDDSLTPYITLWYTQTLDHFSFRSNANFSQRYLVASQYWNTNGSLSNGCPGPIIFYTGNEGDITWFYNNTGFVTNILAQQLGALIVFAEHRYYGDTLPFGNQSFAADNVVYLTSEQALADYAVMIEDLRNGLLPLGLSKPPSAAKCPVVVAGGSYGGMLSSWFRMKYPHLAQGALAASAPIAQFAGTGFDEYAFDAIATQDFQNCSLPCKNQIQQALIDLVKIGSDSAGRSQLTQTFVLCQPLKSYEDTLVLYEWLSAGLTYMAMVDYPYPANFLEPMPGWPVCVACDRMTASPNTNSTQLLNSLYSAISVYYNYTGQAGSCNDINSDATSNLGDQAWDYQACTEMVMPIASNGQTDMFLPEAYHLSSVIEGCQYSMHVTPRPGWVPTYYGGYNISAASNIVFSNGQLDPWRGGGITSNKGLDPSVVTLVIEQGAHHLDLRLPNAQDPPSVTQARQIEIQNIQQWINQYVQSHP